MWRIVLAWIWATGAVAQTCTSIGAHTQCSDGSSAARIGDTVFISPGGGAQTEAPMSGNGLAAALGVSTALDSALRNNVEMQRNRLAIDEAARDRALREQELLGTQKHQDAVLGLQRAQMEAQQKQADRAFGELSAGDKAQLGLQQATLGLQRDQMAAAQRQADRAFNELSAGQVLMLSPEDRAEYLQRTGQQLPPMLEARASVGLDEVLRKRDHWKREDKQFERDDKRFAREERQLQQQDKAQVSELRKQGLSAALDTAVRPYAPAAQGPSDKVLPRAFGLESSLQADFGISNKDVRDYSARNNNAPATKLDVLKERLQGGVELMMKDPRGIGMLQDHGLAPAKPVEEWSAEDHQALYSTMTTGLMDLLRENPDALYDGIDEKEQATILAGAQRPKGLQRAVPKYKDSGLGAVANRAGSWWDDL